jgi:hypothetical protein
VLGEKAYDFADLSASGYGRLAMQAFGGHRWRLAVGSMGSRRTDRGAKAMPAVHPPIPIAVG